MLIFEKPEEASDIAMQLTQKIAYHFLFGKNFQTNKRTTRLFELRMRLIFVSFKLWEI